MNFYKWHKALTYGLAAVSFLAVAISGFISVPVVVLTIVGFVASWIWEEVGASIAGTHLWNGIVVAVLAIFSAQGFITGEWLIAAINFTTFVLIGKLFSRRNAKDIFQCYLLSFLLFIASAVINPGISYAVIFPFFIVFLTLALVMLHLLRDLTDIREQNQAVHGPDVSLRREEALLLSGQVFRPSFMIGTGALALTVFVSSLVIFFAFPRLGLGFFLGKRRAETPVSGFSDQIRLGRFGAIRTNQQVVIRVVVRKGPRQVRLRGMSFDRYTGAGWLKTFARRRPPRSMTSRGVTEYSISHGQPDTEMVIYQEPLSSAVMFGEPRVVKVLVKDFRDGMPDPNAPKVRRDRAGDLTFRVRGSVAVNYTVLSHRERPTADRLRRAIGITPLGITDLYTQLPPTLTPRIKALAERVTRGKVTRYDQVSALERHLQTVYRYSLEGGHEDKDPVSDFLFKKKYGHCEFFATSMVLMARSLGLPARVVTGFYGGAWNDLGSYVAIRQSDAHAWVEVYFPGHHWVTFDPTPSGRQVVPGESGFLGWLQQYMDSLKLRWYMWVIEYDLHKQIEMFQSVFTWMRKRLGGRRTSRLTWFGIRDWFKRIFTLKNFLKAMGIALLLYLLYRVVMRLWGGRFVIASRRIRRTLVQRQYRRMLQILGRRGYIKGVCQTPLEFLDQLKADRFAGVLLVQRITAAYHDATFGGRDVDSLELDSCLKALRRVTEQLA